MDDDVDMAPAVNKLRIHEDQENFPAGQGANKGPLKSALKIYEDKPASAVPFEVTAMDCGVTFSKVGWSLCWIYFKKQQNIFTFSIISDTETMFGKCWNSGWEWLVHALMFT